MAHLTADKHHNIAFEQTTKGVIKRRSGETVTVQATVRSDAGRLEVEARTAAHDGDITRSYPLTTSDDDDNHYQTTITCQETGKFPVKDTSQTTRG